MTLFFNLENVSAEANGDPKRFMQLLYNLYYKRLPKQSFRAPRLPLVGTSFLLNPEPILQRPKGVDILFIKQYVELAARRDYSLYKLYGYKVLPLSYFPDINQQAINNNPLLNIENNELQFYYE